MRYFYTLILLLICSWNPIFPQMLLKSIVNQSTKTTTGTMNVQNENNIYFVYKRGSGSTQADNQVKVSISNNGGVSFSETDITPAGSVSNERPVIASNINSVLIKYNTNDGNNTKCVLARSTNMNTSFSSNIIDDNELESCGGLQSDGISKYTLQDSYSRLYVSIDDGVSFKKANIPNANLYRRLITLTPKNIWLTGIMSGKDSIFVYNSTDQGNSWRLVTKIYADLPYYDDFRVAKQNDDLFIAWTHEEVGTYTTKTVLITNTSVGQIKDIHQASNKDFLLDRIIMTSNKINFLDSDGKPYYYSTDKGSSWSRNYNLQAELDNNLNDWYAPYSGDIHFLNDNTVYLRVTASRNSNYALEDDYFLKINISDIPISNIKNDSTITDHNQIYFDTEQYSKQPKYQFQLSTNNNFTSNTLDKVYDNKDYSYSSSYDMYFILDLNNILANATKYYYRIRGVDGSYYTPWSSTYSFVYGITISKPTILQPVNNETFHYPGWITASWTKLSEVNDYQYHIASSISFTDTIMHILWNASSPKASLYPYGNGEFYWRVRGYQYSTGSFGPWSDPVSFNYDGVPVTGVSEEKEIPKEFKLTQNYPNPFNPSTVISFSLPKESNVKLTIFNELGETVAELLNYTKPAGNHEVNFNASGLSSGLYFYILEARSSDGKDNYRNIKKMLLVK